MSREAVRSIGAVGLACPGAVPGIFDILLDHLTGNHSALTAIFNPIVGSDTPRDKGVASEAVVVLKQLLRSGVASGREHIIELVSTSLVALCGPVYDIRLQAQRYLRSALRMYRGIHWARRQWYGFSVSAYSPVNAAGSNKL